MRRLNTLLCIAIAILAAAADVSAAPPQPQHVELLVSAAASLKDALGDVNDLYHAQHPDVSVSLNLGGSGTLEMQIEQGAPADIFISAAPEEMDALESKGLLRAGTRIALLTNRLVLIVPKGNRDVYKRQIEDRAIPGHWEGDLIGGTKNSHIATLVERHSRFTTLVKVRSKDTAAVVAALSRQIRRLPTSLRLSLIHI